MSTQHFLLPALVFITWSATASAQQTEKPSTDIWQAAATGQTAVLKEHIAAGTDLNATEPLAGNSPLILASIFGHTESVKALLEAGAKLEVKNKEQTTALFNAVFFGHPAVVKALVEKGADIHATEKTGGTILQFVSAPWSPEIEGIYRLVYGLLQVELDVERTKKFRVATARYLTAQAKQRPRLSKATEALFAAVLAGDVAKIKQALARGAKINAKDPHGNTPLQVAAVLGKAKAARALLAAKAELESKNRDGATALYNASFFAHEELVQLLLDAGAKTDVKSHAGVTALELAKSDWSKELEGIYLAIYRRIGMSPELARIKKHRGEVAKRIESHLAKEKKTVAASRTWTTADGKKTVQASMVSATETKVTLKRKDGRQVTVPITALSEADQTYIGEQAKKK